MQETCANHYGLWLLLYLLVLYKWRTSVGLLGDDAVLLVNMKMKTDNPFDLKTLQKQIQALEMSIFL